MEESCASSERRSGSRYTVDEAATLVLLSQGATLPARLTEISLEGCRLGLDRQAGISTPAGIEVMFRINGIGFRMSGIMHWIDGHKTAGIEFSGLAERRRQSLVELLAELEAQERAAAALNEGHAAESPSMTPKGCDVLVAPPAGGPRRDAKPVPEPTAAAENKHQPELVLAKERPAVTATRDRREQQRHAVDARATVFFIDVRAQISGRVLDVSTTGCRIRADERFPVGIYRRVEIEFKMDGLPFRLAGVVQSVHDKFTVGIRFLDLSPRKRDQLALLMEEIEEMRAELRAQNQD
jgi:hypothetical protein